ncbi:toll/interleukin-1 receptor domain-containing protein [Denitromonas iodatirespirans]|uniref:toll/interleukin-1 receptor domain-containing protein n=1 Tax=Denitromonas iodatirespirans TaxID=2795389 RepID=UPI001BDD3D79|nr:TIR domain-containing protein [Denitromonas iodatirespirans]
MSGIFISHSSRDNAAAEDLAERLRAQGYQSLFLDFDPADGIPAGRHWEREIYARLRSCSGVVVLCSAHSMASDWCFAEMTHARALGKQLFPLIIDDCELRAVLLDTQAVDLRPDAEAGYARLWAGMRSAGLDPTDSFDWDIRRPPYPGLTPFEADDAAVYFGREDDRRRCLDTLAQMRRYGGDRLLIVVGASGSGKSSLVRAGVIPKLRQMPGWQVLGPMRPLRQPVEALAKVLPDGARERFGGEAGARALAMAMAGEADERPATLLVVDQLEELVTTSEVGAAARFVELLQAALADAACDLYCLATLRSDYLAALQTHSAWGQVPFREMSLGPMTLRHFAEIIAKPAEVAGIELEPGLVETLVQDTGTADALPLLAFALNRLWRDFGQDGTITLAEYTDRIGGLAGAIGQEADAVLAALKPTSAQLADLQRAFRQMVRVDPEGRYTRRSVHWQDIPEAVHPLMEAFVKARLLVAGHDAASDDQPEARTLEVAHEALFRAWGRLKRWLDEDRAFLLWRQHVRPEAQAWQGAPRDPGLLLRGGPLAEARRWQRERGDELGDELQAFIAASRKAAQRTRLRRRLIEAGVTLGLVAMAGLGVALWQQHQETQAQLVNSYWSGAVSARDAGGDALKAAHYFARAADLSESADQRTNALVAAGALSGGLELAAMFSLPHSPDAVVVSPAGAVLLSWAGPAVRLDDLRSARMLASKTHDAPVAQAVLTADQQVVSRDMAGSVWLWGGTPAARELAPHGVAGMAVDDAGRHLLAWSAGAVQVWALPTGESLGRLALPQAPDGARFIDGQTVVAWAADGRFWRWRVGTVEPQATWASNCAVRGVVPGEGGELLSWCDTALLRHEALAGRVAARWASPETIDGARWVPGRALVLSWNTARGRLRLWRAEDGAPSVGDALARAGSIARVLVTPDGSRFVTSGAGGDVETWEVGEEAPAARATHGRGEALVKAALDASGTRVLAWSAAAGARLWDTDTMTPLSLPLRHDARLAGAAFFDAGEGVVTWAEDASMRVWRRHPDRELTTPTAPPAGNGRAPGPTPPDAALKARLDALGLHGYQVFDRRENDALVGTGPLARRLGPDDVVSAPLTLAEGVGGGALLPDGQVVLWGNTTVQLWDGTNGQPLTALLRADVLYPDGVRVDTDLLSWTDERARRWRWPVPDTAGTSAQQWLARSSATQMDAQGAITVLTRARWCALPRATPPAGCADAVPGSAHLDQ